MSPDRSTRRAFVIVAGIALLIATLVALLASRWLASLQRQRDADLATLPAPDLDQWTLDGAQLPHGGSTSGGALLGARITRPGIAIDVEVGAVRFHAGASVATGMARIQFVGEPGPYRWRARLVSATVTGPWRDFGEPPATDFTIVARPAEAEPQPQEVSPSEPPPPAPAPEKPRPDDRTDAKGAIGTSPAFSGGEGGAWPGPLPSVEHYDSLWQLLAMRLRWIAVILLVAILTPVFIHRWIRRRAR